MEEEVGTVEEEEEVRVVEVGKEEEEEATGFERSGCHRFLIS